MTKETVRSLAWRYGYREYNKRMKKAEIELKDRIARRKQDIKPWRAISYSLRKLRRIKKMGRQI